MSSAENKTSIQKFLASRAVQNWAVVLIALFFVFQLIYFATTIPDKIFPDEVVHFKHCQLYLKTWNFFLHESPESYELGTVSTVAPLYFFILGKSLLLNPGIDPLLFLRFINVGISLFAFLVFHQFLVFLKVEGWARLASLIVYSNTLMLVFLGAAVSYDNLTNLFSLLIFLYWAKFLKVQSLQNALIFTLFSSLGLLTKFTLFPLIFLLGVFALFPLSKAKKANLRKHPRSFKNWMLIFLVVLTFLPVASLYGSNFYHFGTLSPSPEQVLGKDIAYHFHENTRRNIDFAATASQRLQLSFPAYLQFWSFDMLWKTFGILSHRNMTRDFTDIFWYELVFVIALLTSLTSLFKSKLDYYWALLSIFFIYAGILFYQNYKDQLEMNWLGLGVQGRYLFPVYPIAIAILFKKTYQVLRSGWKMSYFVFTSVVFFNGGFFFFLSNRVTFLSGH